jgi:preprotein translocase subunit SecG
MRISRNIRRNIRRGMEVGQLVLVVFSIVVAFLIGFYILQFTGRAGTIASFSVSATGIGGAGGTYAVLTITIKNTGTATIYITDIYIRPASQNVQLGNLNPSSITISGRTGNINLVAGGAAPTPQTSGGIAFGAGESATFTIEFQNSVNLYAGTRILISVYGYDPATKNLLQQSTEIILQ